MDAEGVLSDTQDRRNSPHCQAGRSIERGSEANITAIRCQWNGHPQCRRTRIRACANRSAACLRGRRARNARSSGELSKLPNVKEPIRSRAIQPYIIEPIWERFFRPVARAKGNTSVGLVKCALREQTSPQALKAFSASSALSSPWAQNNSNCPLSRRTSKAT